MCTILLVSYMFSFSFWNIFFGNSQLLSGWNCKLLLGTRDLRRFGGILYIDAVFIMRNTNIFTGVNETPIYKNLPYLQNILQSVHFTSELKFSRIILFPIVEPNVADPKLSAIFRVQHPRRSMQENSLTLRLFERGDPPFPPLSVRHSKTII